MSPRSLQWIKHFGTGLMILVIALMLFNKAAYTHVHILPDGSLVTHAHPFSNQADGKKTTSHKHSSIEFFLLNLLEVLLLSALTASLLIYSISTTRFRLPVPGQLLPALVPVTPGRAPPACM